MARPTAFLCGAVKTALEHAAWPDPAPEIAWGTVGALRDRILAGERPAVTVLSADAVALLAARGIVRAGSVLPLGRTVTGLAVRDGAPRRPIGTEAGFVAALRAADSIAWADGRSGATAGKHFEGVIAKLGLADELRAKARLVQFGVEAVAACERGEVELAVSQGTEIVGRPGVGFLGPFPDPHGLSTAYAAAALEETPAAAGLMAVLRAPETRRALAALGFIP